MSDAVTNELIYEMLKRMQGDLAKLRRETREMNAMDIRTGVEPERDTEALPAKNEALTGASALDAFAKKVKAAMCAGAWETDGQVSYISSHKTP